MNVVTIAHIIPYRTPSAEFSAVSFLHKILLGVPEVVAMAPLLRAQQEVNFWLISSDLAYFIFTSRSDE
jgi:hypothetical protein